MDRSDLFALFERAADGVHIVAADQRIIFWNSAASRILGYRAEEVVGRFCFDVVSGGDYQGHSFCRRHCPTIQAAIRGKSVPNYDVLSRTKDGRDVWLNMSVLPAPDPDGNGALAVHLFRDVSKRRRAEILAQQTIAAVSKFSPAGKELALLESYPAPPPLLTRRELEILRLLSCGMRVAQIAESLAIKQSTARNHIEHILAKLGVHSRLEAVVFAAQHRLV
jgi:PAS domain S-box-containing protein